MKASTPTINKEAFDKASGRDATAMIIKAYRKAGHKVMSFKAYDSSNLRGFRYLAGSFVVNTAVHAKYI